MSTSEVSASASIYYDDGREVGQEFSTLSKLSAHGKVAVLAPLIESVPPPFRVWSYPSRDAPSVSQL